jgi:hypothetical protein
MRFKLLRSAVVRWVARRLRVPIKVRDTYYGADIGCSHVGFEPSFAVTSEANPR